MSLTDLEFIFIFLPLSLLIYKFSTDKLKNSLLFILSLVFYSWGQFEYLFLLIIMIFLTYILGLRMGKKRFKDKSDKWFFLVLSISLVSMPLVFYKYYQFIIDNINAILSINLRIKKLPLPLGLSFYTFKIISYLSDVYRGQVKHQSNIINLGLYISIFPQIGSGPITQYNEMIGDIDKRGESRVLFSQGVEKFILGLSKKIIIANNLQPLWLEVKSLPVNEISTLTAWLGILAYSLQLYFDFSGYSDMAIGVGNMFGFSWGKNFNYPYLSKSIKEFWNRWHISLGKWFRDYIYIPLGGNRRGPINHLRNILIVWIFTGLWHGANWNFILWGLYYALILSLEKYLLEPYFGQLKDGVKRIYTLLIVIIGWVIFDLFYPKDIFNFIKTMFGMGKVGLVDSHGKYLLVNYLLILLIGIIGSGPLVKNIINRIKRKDSPYLRNGVYLYYIIIFILSISMLVGETFSSFLYFDF